MNHYTISFFHAFARSGDFEFQLILYLGPSNFGSEIVLKNARHLVRSDLFVVFCLFFCKDRHKTLKYVDEFPE